MSGMARRRWLESMGTLFFAGRLPWTSIRPSGVAPEGAGKPLKLADFQPRGAMAEKYGVYLPDKGITGRAVVIVNKAGKVAWIKNYDIPVVPDLKEVAAALQQVKTATA